MKNNGKKPQKTKAQAKEVLSELLAIRAELAAQPSVTQSRMSQVHANYQESAHNLLHYMALRRRDLRPLQLRLASMGLSSLGRAESHVLATVDALVGVLQQLVDDAWTPPAATGSVVDFNHGESLLAEHARNLLGPAPPGREVRIMVTMPVEAARDSSLVHNLLQQGMDCMRINCAHDTASDWTRMIQNLRHAEQALGRSCRVVMDLAGPKLRTGPMEPGPAVVRIRPQRNVFGTVIAPARIWLTPETNPQQPPSPASATLPVPNEWLAHLRPGEQVRFKDARESRRALKIVEVTDQGCWAEATQTAYLVPGTRLRHGRKKEESGHRSAKVGNLPATENVIHLHKGDKLILTRDQVPGRPASYDSVGQILTPPRIGCSIPAVFDDVEAGDSIWFDDGRIGGVVDQVEARQVVVRITQARTRGETLRADKGINLPDSNLQLEALTEKDLADLAFVAQHADIVELSFANSAQDVESLQKHLATLCTRQPAVVLKIETKRGFENLPAMLLTAMKIPCCGVMIARGDLAVECGFERLAEVQEEILWICEAAHVPVIWATQVLESLAKEGMPSRAEITDAAMGHRAECVMLNKGVHIVSAVRVLDDILRRMRSHQAKKRSMLRELHLAHTLSEAPPTSKAALQELSQLHDGLAKDTPQLKQAQNA